MQSGLLIACFLFASTLGGAFGAEETVIVECFECPHQGDFDIDLADITRVEGILCLNTPYRVCEQRCLESNETNLRKLLLLALIDLCCINFSVFPFRGDRSVVESNRNSNAS